MRWSLSALAVALASAALAAEKPNPAAIARQLDRHISEKLATMGVSPAAPADDATFLRRTHLLLVGRIPMPSEVYAFLEDRDPRKREKLIDRLLASTGYANHFMSVWRGWLIPEATTRVEIAGLAPEFELWLRKRLVANIGYDKIVTELLTTPVDPYSKPVTETELTDTQRRIVFYTAKSGRPESLATASARVFLGVQLDCAQCHDHPFARWTRDQFWGLAAFFAGIERLQATNEFSDLREVYDRRELAIPNFDRVVQATFLDGKPPVWKPRTSSRATFAQWVTARGNPYFAQATVNRLWGYVFGIGFVDPVDGFNDENRPSHPRALATLADAFAESGYDLRFLLKTILLTEVYQRDSVVTDPRQANPRLFAHFPIQAMTPEQLYDSLTLIASAGEERPGGQFLQNSGSPKRQFLDTFGMIGNKTQSTTSILQALTLMNGELVEVATDPKQSRPVSVVVGLAGLSDEDRVEILYFTALGRRPKPTELERALRHIRGDPANPKKRYGDLLWALLNAAEFRTNH